MRYGASQLFTIVLLALLAGLSFLLQRAVAPGEIRRDGKFRHEPDAIAENLMVRQFDEEGRVKYRLTAPHMNHFPDDDSSELKISGPCPLPSRCTGRHAVGQQCTGYQQGAGDLPVG
jgi:lipopolysaccharide export system protein LptC